MQDSVSLEIGKKKTNVTNPFAPKQSLIPKPTSALSLNPFNVKKDNKDKSCGNKRTREKQELRDMLAEQTAALTKALEANTKAIHTQTEAIFVQTQLLQKMAVGAMTTANLNTFNAQQRQLTLIATRIVGVESNVNRIAVYLTGLGEPPVKAVIEDWELQMLHD